MNIDDLTIGQAKELAAQFSGVSAAPTAANHAPMAVLVCTDKRGVFFGHTINNTARPLVLTDARMCLYWSSDVGGVLGLAEIGPTKDCKVSATVSSITIEGVTCVISVDEKAAKAWAKAPVQGR